MTDVQTGGPKQPQCVDSHSARPYIRAGQRTCDSTTSTAPMTKVI